MKFRISRIHSVRFSSPSMRREWIEISQKPRSVFDSYSLPPCGGSGLKYDVGILLQKFFVSPSMRREWIEIRIVFLLY